MHLVTTITLGVFGGLWLFTRWTEWQAKKRLRLLDSHLNPDLRKYRQAAE